MLLCPQKVYLEKASVEEDRDRYKEEAHLLAEQNKTLEQEKALLEGQLEEASQNLNVEKNINLQMQQDQQIMDQTLENMIGGGEGNAAAHSHFSVNDGISQANHFLVPQPQYHQQYESLPDFFSTFNVDNF